MSADCVKRRGRPRQSSTRASSLQLDSRNLPYARRQHTVRELLALHRSRGERSPTASGVALPDVEREMLQMPRASSLVTAAPLCMSSLSPRSSSLSSSTSSTIVRNSVEDRRASEVRRSVVDFVAESRCVDDVPETAISFDARDAPSISSSLWPSSCEQPLLNRFDDVPDSELSAMPSSDADWNELIALLVAQSDEMP